jgi:hypothetical protein
MTRDTNPMALIAAMLLGLVDVVYVRLASGPSQQGPTAVALLFITGAVLACMAGAILPWKPARIALLMGVVVASFSLGIVSFSIGVGLMLGAILAGAGLLIELKEATPTDGIAAAIGGIGGFSAVALAWLVAINGP